MQSNKDINSATQSLLYVTWYIGHYPIMNMIRDLQRSISFCLWDVIYLNVSMLLKVKIHWYIILAHDLPCICQVVITRDFVIEFILKNQYFSTHVSLNNHRAIQGNTGRMWWTFNIYRHIRFDIQHFTLRLTYSAIRAGETRSRHENGPSSYSLAL